MSSDHPQPAQLELFPDQPLCPTSELEARAREIYDGWSHYLGWVPWIPGGNSDNQTAARALALAALTTSKESKKCSPSR